jgi:hypothetical protein
MRDILARYNDQRLTILATVLRHGWHSRANGRQFPTLLLGNVHTVSGTRLCEHCWVYRTSTLHALALQPGDLLQCTARVRKYTKGYGGRHATGQRPTGIDYAFEHLEHCVCVLRRTPTTEEIVDDKQLRRPC